MDERGPPRRGSVQRKLDFHRPEIPLGLPLDASDFEKRVDQCAALMREGKWVRGQTVKELAKEWGVTDKYARAFSAEAWRRVRSEDENPDEAAVTIGNYCRKVMDRAEKTLDHKSGIEAAKTLAMVIGAMSPKKTEISGPNGGPIALHAAPASEAEAKARVLAIVREAALQWPDEVAGLLAKGQVPALPEKT